MMTSTIPPHDDDDDDDGPPGYMELELFVAEGPETPDGEGWHCTLKWLNPLTLLDVARDLVAAAENGQALEPVMRMWSELLELALDGDDDG